jgi:predicted HicB family RNase H-like nuclease
MSAKSEQLEQELKGEEASSSDEVCASCGIAAVDDVTLKDCDDGCDLVKYCGDGCQENHRELHEAACKKRVDEIRDDIQRRAAELRQTFLSDELHDKQLFTQNDSSHLGECPICCLPLSIDPSKSPFMTCCSKSICNGCNYANTKREREQGLEQRCVYCREPLPESEEEEDKRVMERIKKNDPAAMTYMGKKHDREGDYEKSLPYHTKAAELGDVCGKFCIGTLYYRGEGVEKDMEKAVYHLEQAAIGGHPQARGILASYELRNGRFERAAKHLIINANLGCDFSLQLVKKLYIEGVVSKEEYAAALRGYQAAVDATKSAEREKAEAEA